MRAGAPSVGTLPVNNDAWTEPPRGLPCRPDEDVGSMLLAAGETADEARRSARARRTASRGGGGGEGGEDKSGGIGRLDADSALRRQPSGSTRLVEVAGSAVGVGFGAAEDVVSPCNAAEGRQKSPCMDTGSSEADGARLESRSGGVPGAWCCIASHAAKEEVLAVLAATAATENMGAA